ncbi:hypothetical protein Cgig2_005702 [Carnegiea gigantea]|uniref:Bet v I/Major latex protein domain-containing protein n=1 Tax=Carnegiea gigantea TaxID=171969 RepID=A0A9Q1KHX2_9CARY|nr:hypothetical protein Cgig2_005702 [Carnegiea gigantea]
MMGKTHTYAYTYQRVYLGANWEYPQAFFLAQVLANFSTVYPHSSEVVSDFNYRTMTGYRRGKPTCEVSTKHDEEQSKLACMVAHGKTGCIKKKIEDIKEENRLITFTVVEGDVLKEHHKSPKAKLQVIPKGKGSLVKWTFEYEKLNHEAREASTSIDILLNLTKYIDAYVANA